MLSLLLLPATLWAKQAPPQDFTSGYQLPITTTPFPRAEWLAYLDVAVLLAALLLATYLVYKARSRCGIFTLMVFSLLYFGFYRHGCICTVGSLQNIALATWNSQYALPITVALFFLLPLLFALFVGRVFCSGVCPLGAAQDLVLIKPVTIPRWLEHPLGLLPYFYLGAAVLFAATNSTFPICRYDPFVAFFRMNGSLAMLIFGAGFLLLSAFVGRPYCRFLCPYSVLLRLLSPFSRKQVSITPTTCVQCRLCEHACPFGAILTPTTGDHPEPRPRGRRRLALLLMVLPVLIAVGGLLGWRGSGMLAAGNPTIRLATRVWAEEKGMVKGDTDESRAFRKLGEPNDVIYRQAGAIRRQFDLGGMLFGGWVGLVLGLKLLSLAVHRRREDYEADPAACLACGRCYQYCPQEQQRIEQEVVEPV
ncbi:MAG: 4Fe-4S binding protein [Armatimonadota bacterium]